MPTTLEPHWQLDCLREIAQEHPDLVQAALATLWQQYPGLRREVTLRAVSAKRITKREASVCLGLAAEEVARLARDTQHVESNIRTALVECEVGRPALLPESRLPVWEVVRKFRELGGREEVLAFFTGLSAHELEAALSYAAAHTQEIDLRIEEYEEYQAQRIASQLS